MSLKQNLTTHLMERCGGIVDIKENPEVLDEIVNQVKAHLEAEKGSGSSAPSKSSAPFGVQWMDSWVAHHVFSERISDLQSKNRAVASLLQGMVDVQFNARLAEIRELLSRTTEPPDAGPPEPGAPPPAGPAHAHTPAITIAAEPPDAGPPEPGAPPPAGPARAHNPKFTLASEPGSPPVGPAGAHGGVSTASEPGSPPVGPAGAHGGVSTASEPGSPPVGPAGAHGGVSTASEPGSPPVGPAGGHSGLFVSEEPEPPDGGTPEPGVPPEPPAGPDPGGPESTRFADNPWILYWFISLKTPVLLDVIDLHISRRLEALQH